MIHSVSRETELLLIILLYIAFLSVLQLLADSLREFLQLLLRRFGILLQDLEVLLSAREVSFGEHFELLNHVSQNVLGLTLREWLAISSGGWVDNFTVLHALDE